MVSTELTQDRESRSSRSCHPLSLSLSYSLPLPPTTITNCYEGPAGPELKPQLCHSRDLLAAASHRCTRYPLRCGRVIGLAPAVLRLARAMCV